MGMVSRDAGRHRVDREDLIVLQVDQGERGGAWFEPIKWRQRTHRATSSGLAAEDAGARADRSAAVRMISTVRTPAPRVAHLSVYEKGSRLHPIDRAGTESFSHYCGHGRPPCSVLPGDRDGWHRLYFLN
jgi:hypothetical protein